MNNAPPTSDLKFIAFCAAFLILGLTFLVGSANWIINIRAFSARAITTTATITTVRADYDSTSSPSRTYYYPTVTFTHDNQTHTVESRSGSETPLAQGDAIEILFDPQDPTIAHAPASNFTGLGGALTLAIAMTAFGALFTLIPGALIAITIAGDANDAKDKANKSDLTDA